MDQVDEMDVSVSPSARLRELGITLPVAAKPVGAYAPACRIGTSVRTSGQLPFINGSLNVTGKVGADVSPEAAYEQARIAALNAIAAAAAEAGGIDAIRRISHVTVFVASSVDFTGQPAVANGASDILQKIFGTAGVHTRSAVGVAVLPLNSPVEVEISCEAEGA